MRSRTPILLASALLLSGGCGAERATITPTALLIEPQLLHVLVGETLQVRALVGTDGRTSQVEGEVSFMVADTTIARVVGDSNVAGVRAGTTRITARATYRGAPLTTSATVSVREQLGS